MIKKVLIFLSLLVISISVFFVFKTYQAYQNMPEIYVDGNYKKKFQWGSKKHPYNDIHKAFEAALKKTNLPNVYLKNGEYLGNIEIPENMKVYGESREKVIFKNYDSSSKILMRNNSSLFNLTVNGETTGILAEGKAEIENCSVTGKITGILAKKQITIKNCSIIGGITGILAEEKAEIENCSVKEFIKIGINASSNEFEIIIKNSEISNGNGKGVYVQRGRKMLISDNIVYNNKEEGLDLRQVVSGEITGNKIYNNEESGIESVVSGSYLKIYKNEIWGNKSNGITFQYYEDEKKEAEIIIEENKISAADPEHYAISVANPSGEKNKPENFWRKSIKIYNNNILKGGIRTRSLEITKK
jgi:hypothetical protein